MCNYRKRKSCKLTKIWKRIHKRAISSLNPAPSTKSRKKNIRYVHRTVFILANSFDSRHSLKEEWTPIPACRWPMMVTLDVNCIGLLLPLHYTFVVSFSIFFSRLFFILSPFLSLLRGRFFFHFGGMNAKRIVNSSCNRLIMFFHPANVIV